MDLLKAKDEIANLNSVLHEMQVDIDERHLDLHNKAINSTKPEVLLLSLACPAQLRDRFTETCTSPNTTGSPSTAFLDNALQQFNTRFQDKVNEFYKGSTTLIPCHWIENRLDWKIQMFPRLEIRLWEL